MIYFDIQFDGCGRGGLHIETRLLLDALSSWSDSCLAVHIPGDVYLFADASGKVISFENDHPTDTDTRFMQLRGSDK